MKIKELAEKTGLTPYTIRFYEKEGLLDSQHFHRDEYNYRHYSNKAIERLKMIKKFQGLDCSLAELRKVFQQLDANSYTNQEVMEWIHQKMGEIERKKEEYDQMLGTLRWMFEYRKALDEDPQKAHAMYLALHADEVIH